ncbi:MAG: tyrosine-type recombinase/integrase [SAR324 cluster bacterium]|nr:tyrosine-type recombinase/integrase [SAR324 cluster bacterium]
MGAPLANVQELMGHEVIETTMRYAHLAPDHDASDISLLSKFVTDL